MERSTTKPDAVGPDAAAPDAAPPGPAPSSSLTQDGPSAATPDVDLTGQKLGDYSILHRLGQGGMGQVYLAEQTSLKRKVALKLLKPELAFNAKSLTRFKQEAEAVARATHANIVQVYAIGEVGGVHFMALEFVEGRNLREFLEKKGPPEVMLGLSIMRQVASALERANELGIIHRDIKPDNILITRKGEVKVADFGLSHVFSENSQDQRLTKSNETMGTPLYMSPEQVEGNRNIDHRTDIYSFGVTCYHMFAGHPPFRGTSPFKVAVQHVQNEPSPLAEIRPDLPAELCAIIHKMMAKAPDARYQSGREIVREVSRLRDALVGASGVHGTPGATIAGLIGDSTQAISTVNLPKLPSSSWTKRLLVMLPIALGVGLFIGWLQNYLSHSRPAPPPVEEPAPAAKALFSPKEREKILQSLVQEHTKPGTALDMAAGLKHSIDLGLLYLKERDRLDDADKHFKMLIDTQVVSYKILGRLGQAMVLAFRDEPKKSNTIFLAVVEPERIGKKGAAEAANKFWKSDPSLREMVSRALNHNYQNDPKGFPEDLEKYRRPPPPRLTPAPKGKGLE